VPLDS